MVKCVIYGMWAGTMDFLKVGHLIFGIACTFNKLEVPTLKVYTIVCVYLMLHEVIGG